MERIAVFPGSFDPITIGHESLIRRALPLFDKIIIAIGVNSNKNYFFDLATRKKWIEDVFSDSEKVDVQTYEGLTINFCEKVNSRFILRGIRTAADFEFERTIALMNTAQKNEIETIFLVSSAEYSAINSTVIREIIRNNGDARPFVPKAVTL